MNEIPIIEDMDLLETLFYTAVSEVEETVGITLTEEQLEQLQTMYMRGAYDAISALLFGYTGFDTCATAIHREAEEYLTGDLDEEDEIASRNTALDEFDEDEDSDEGYQAVPENPIGVPGSEGSVH